MPIYEYRCSECGFEDEFLRKISEPPLTECPKCGKATFTKLISAAGFQLKGSGWYATDFKGGNGATKSAAKSETGGETKAEGKAESASDTRTESKIEAKAETKTPASSGSTTD